MKRVALVLVVLLATAMARPAHAEPARPSRAVTRASSRHRVAARNIGLIASLLTMPWSAMMLAHEKRHPSKRVDVPTNAGLRHIANGRASGAATQAPEVAVPRSVAKTPQHP